MAGLKLNTPWLLNWFGSGVGDYFSVQGIYTQGALRYLMQNPNNNWWIQDGQSAAYGVMSDGVYGGSAFNGTATSIQLTTAWGVNIGYEHFWTPRWRTSLYGGYTSVSYDSQANNMLCVLQGDGNGLNRQPGACKRWLQQQLDVLVGWFAHSVERDEGLLYGS